MVAQLETPVNPPPQAMQRGHHKSSVKISAQHTHHHTISSPPDTGTKNHASDQSYPELIRDCKLVYHSIVLEKVTIHSYKTQNGSSLVPLGEPLKVLSITFLKPRMFVYRMNPQRTFEEPFFFFPKSV